MSWTDTLPLTDVVNWRRHLHRHPELSFQESETARYIFAELSAIPHLTLSRPSTYGVVAELRGAHPGKTIALRADTDALPVTEESGVDFASETPGVMHACGHDTHTAMLMGAAKTLAGLRDELHGCIRFIFQPAEEVPPGGAKDLVAAGVFDDVEYVFGLHIFPRRETGTIGLCSGFVTASQDIFDLKIQGKGSHGSTPELSIDPITIGAELISSLNTIVSRNVAAFDNAVLSFGQFTAGEVYNVIPDTAHIKGTVRTMTPEVRALMKQRIFTVIDHVLAAHGGTYKLDWLDGYSSVFNDEEATAIVKKAADAVVGEAAQFSDIRMMGSEDFSAYTEVCKGSFFSLGGGSSEEGYAYMSHNPKFIVDEKSFATGVKMHVQIALECLGAPR
jgi:amidohydrolase